MHLFSQESEALTSQQSGLDGTTSSTASGRSFRVKSSSTTSRTPNNMKTSKTSTQLSIEDGLMSSAEDSHASRSASQDFEREQRTNATCGRRCLELSENVNPVGSLARTFAGLLIGRMDWYSKRVALTWKLLGTPSNRLLFQLVPQARPTDATEFGLLLTPTTREEVMLPTPTTLQIDHSNTRELQIAKGGRFQTINKNGEVFSASLQMIASHGMLPTPIAQQERANASIDRGKGNLSGEVATQFKIGGKTSQLSPLFVEEMMGFPKNWTALPFQNGEGNQSKHTETP